MKITLWNENSEGPTITFECEPYLTPVESLEVADDSVVPVKRLPGPVKYEIEPLPQKLKLKISTEREETQALVGDPVTISFQLEPESDILLKSLKVHVVEIEQTNLRPQSHSLSESMYSSFRDSSRSQLLGRSMMSSSEKSSSFLGLDRSIGVSVILDD